MTESEKFLQNYSILMENKMSNLRREFDKLDLSDSSLDSKEGNKSDNYERNRYCNIFPYDYNRFKLKQVNGYHHDYVNASWLKSGPYIAAQGPLPNTVNDFWRMCYESGTRCIVMLTEFKDEELGWELCHNYLPQEDKSSTFGEITVQFIKRSEERFNDQYYWIATDLEITFQGSTDTARSIRHYHFKTWGDYEPVCDKALLAFVKKVQTFQDQEGSYPDSPLIVHCSAGVGRTGTFIAVDIVTRQAAAMQKEGSVLKVSIPEVVQKLRKERMWMVQTLTQYAMIYQSLKAFLEEEDREMSHL